MTRRGLVLGAGGVIGYTWSVCALRRLETTLGWDPRTADVFIGTSAGSILATELAAGVSTAELLELQRTRAQRAPRSPERWPGAPKRRPLSWSLVAGGLRGRLPLGVALAGALPEGSRDSSQLAASIEHLIPEGQWVDHPNCLVVALDCETGQRVAFGRDGTASSRAAVRASCAVPGWFAPVEIGGRRYIDGGVASATSLDLMAREPVDEVIVVSPMTAPRRMPAGSIGEALERVMRFAVSRTLAAEVAQCERAGVRVIRIEPTAPELAAMGANFMDPQRRAAVLEACLR